VDARNEGSRRFTLAAVVAVAVLCASASPARAERRTTPADRGVVADRTAVRFITPETGGMATPRFLTERQLGFFAKTEAIMEGVPLEPGEYPERYVKLATDRLVARAMLASLMIQAGTEPPDLPKLALEARADLADRVGGPAALDALMQREGIAEDELTTFLRDQVRATYYVDKGVVPILFTTEDALRETFRGALHPYKAYKFDDVRAKMKRWLISERERVAELEFLQGARSRIKIVVVK
jgi:hypothetical protein